MSTQAPTAGGSFAVTCAGFTSGEQVGITLDRTSQLGSGTANASGSVSDTVTLPAGVTGTHTIVCAGVLGESASMTITIKAAAGPSGGGGGVALTGVAVMGIGGLGVALLIGGGLFLLVGQRRKVSA